MQSKNVDIFGSFLNGAPSADSIEPLPAVNPSAQIESEVLQMLSGSETPVDLKTLVTQTSGSPTETLKILQDLEQFNLIDKNVAGDYTITGLGRELKSD